MGSEVVERIPVGTRFALRTEPGYVLTVVEDDGERIVCAATMEGRQKPDRHGEGLRRHILEDFDRLPVPRVGQVWRFCSDQYRLLRPGRIVDGPNAWWCLSLRLGTERYMYNVGGSASWTLVSPAPTLPVEVPPRRFVHAAGKRGPLSCADMCFTCGRNYGEHYGMSCDPPNATSPPAAPPVPEKRAPVACLQCGTTAGVAMRITKRDSKARPSCDECFLDRESGFIAGGMEAENAEYRARKRTQPERWWQPQASRQGTCWRTRGGRW